MKGLTILIALVTFSAGIAQERTKLDQKQIIQKKQVPVQPVKKIDKTTNTPQLRPQKEMWGDYTVTSYNILSTKTPKAKVLQSLIGSLVKLKETNVTGTQIDPFSFEIHEIEQMASSDFIYRAFGRGIRAPEPDLPNSVKVHKTTHEECYGIIQINNDEVAIPYKGVLLFLKRK